MSVKDIHERTFEFACRVVRLHQWYCRRRRGSRTLINQLLNSGTSVGSNLEEARESHYWLRLIEATNEVQPSRIHPLVEEANEIVAILTTIVKNTTTPKP